MNELNLIQTSLKAPKSQYNKFGEYSYRSCEDILEAVKPLLKQTGCKLILSDEVVLIGDRYYIKATAILSNKDNQTACSIGWAREPESRKGQDASQITGASSSYARKYALAGLFALDDNKDPDSTNTHEDKPQPETLPQPKPQVQVRAAKTQSLGEIVNQVKYQQAQDATPETFDNPFIL